mmetsp:Transcript_13041/g.16725  ORF Transcript_13041/g.16725 Transcript_13041/m.16725 type:complete len:92 (+) Transcript_13041:78-353(+)
MATNQYRFHCLWCGDENFYAFSDFIIIHNCLEDAWSPPITLRVNLSIQQIVKPFHCQIMIIIAKTEIPKTSVALKEASSGAVLPSASYPTS